MVIDNVQNTEPTMLTCGYPNSKKSHRMWDTSCTCREGKPFVNNAKDTAIAVFLGSAALLSHSYSKSAL